MGIGVGILLLVLGLILVLGVINMPGSVTQYVDAHTLGWILVIAGVLALVLGLIMSAQAGRSRTDGVERRRD